MTWKKLSVIVIPAIALTLGASDGARADVTNGGFESLTSGYGQLGFNTNATSWTSTVGYNFAMNASNAATGVSGQYGTVALWTTSNGGANTITASPNGGNFIAMDGAFQAPSSISQTVSGLTVGQNYTVSFYWAGAQQKGFDGATDDSFKVTFGAQSQTTNTVNVANHGFSGWMAQSFTFTAGSTSQLLTFLSQSDSSSALPPFALLDGVSVVSTVVPEPSTLGLAASGLLGFGVFKLRRRGRSAGA